MKSQQVVPGIQMWKMSWELFVSAPRDVESQNAKTSMFISTLTLSFDVAVELGSTNEESNNGQIPINLNRSSQTIGVDEEVNL